MEWPSGWLGLVGAFELRIIIRGGQNVHLADGRGAVLDPRVFLLPGSVYDEPRHIRSGCGRKSVSEALSQFGGLFIGNFRGNVVAVDGPEKSGIDKCIRPARSVPSFELFF